MARGAAIQTTGTKIIALEKQRKALELRKAGVTFSDIADAIGYSSPQAAWRAVDAAMKELIQEPVMDLRKLEVERLNYALMKVWPQVQAGDLRAIETMLRIQERMGKVMGSDVPAQVEVHHDGAVLVIDGNEDAYVDSLERMARQAGAIDVQEAPSTPDAVEPSEPLELNPGVTGQMDLFGPADGHTTGVTGNGSTPHVHAVGDPVVDVVAVIAEPCSRYVRPADVERAAKQQCARCDFTKEDHR